MTKDSFFSFLQDCFVHEQSIPLKVLTHAKTCVHIFELTLILEVSWQQKKNSAEDFIFFAFINNPFH